MVIRREDEITGYDLDPRDMGRNAVSGVRPSSESVGLLKTATTMARGKSPEVSTFPPETPKAVPGLIKDAPPAHSSGGGAGPSILSLKIQIKGSITTPDELHIYGTVEGNVRASALTICEGGSVKGEVVAETVVVNGLIEGLIFAQKVQLRASAEVRGDITHNSLGIDSSAIFEGASRRSQDPLADSQKSAKS
jgi:cytoskeletal protein CcmA (bactofilin family)